MNMESLPIIGLEVHIELATKSKMFCACSTDHFGRQPNTQTCPICLGLPGSLPYPNKEAIEKVILVGLALGCQISPLSKFDRKNYFYPDLPKGYQISQYDMPLCVSGRMGIKSEIRISKSETNSKFKIPNSKQIRIRRVHLEEDTGKLIHQAGASLIDFNRSGVPLMEVVTEPDLHSSEEAKIFLESLQQMVRYLGAAEADMEKGQMRCEPTVNLAITKDGKTVYTPLAELKNINSFRFVQKAIDFEIKRQLEEFVKTGEEKGSGNKTTHGWSEARGETVLQREKEEAEDYRYFPEPDLPPMRLRDKEIKILREKIPELPEEKTTRLREKYGLSQTQAQILTTTREKADYFEEAVKMGAKQNLGPGEIANLMVNKRLDSEKLTPQEFVDAALHKKEKSTLPEKEMKKLVEQVMRENQVAVVDYQKGKENALQYLVGQVIRLSQGKAEPNLARKLLKNCLGGA